MEPEKLSALHHWAHLKLVFPCTIVDSHFIAFLFQFFSLNLFALSVCILHSKQDLIQPF